MWRTRLLRCLNSLFLRTFWIRQSHTSLGVARDYHYIPSRVAAILEYIDQAFLCRVCMLKDGLLANVGCASNPILPQKSYAPRLRWCERKLALSPTN